MAKLRLKGRLGVIGAGVMGQALIQGILQSNLLPASKIWAATRSEDTASSAKKSLGVSVVTEYAAELKDTDILVLAIKPAQVQNVLLSLVKSKLPKTTLLISIAAGVTLEDIESALQQGNPVVRAMPNTPIVVGAGMTAFCGGSKTTNTHIESTKVLFESVGKCIELDEHHFDAITGLSGSDPAYHFLIMEALADGGVRVGLPRQVALQVVAQTVLGTALMLQKSGKHPAELRDEVTTPAGCTIGALLTLEDGKIRSVLARAVEQAAQIAGNLGKK